MKFKSPEGDCEKVEGYIAGPSCQWHWGCRGSLRSQPLGESNLWRKWKGVERGRIFYHKLNATWALQHLGQLSPTFVSGNQVGMPPLCLELQAVDLLAEGREQVDSFACSPLASDHLRHLETCEHWGLEVWRNPEGQNGIDHGSTMGSACQKVLELQAPALIIRNMTTWCTR